MNKQLQQLTSDDIPHTLEDDMEYFNLSNPTLEELFITGEIDAETFEANAIAEKLL